MSWSWATCWTRSGLTCPEVSSKVCHYSFSQLENSVSLPWVIYYEPLYEYLHAVSSFSCIPVICPKFVLILTPLKFMYLFCKLSKCTLLFFSYTECPRRNVPDFGRVFLMLKYTDKTQNTHVQSWTVTKIMVREKCGLLAGPRTVPVSWQPWVWLHNMAIQLTLAPNCLFTSFLVIRQYTSVLGIHVMYSAWNPKDNYGMSASVFVVQFNGFMSLIS